MKLLKCCCVAALLFCGITASAQETIFDRLDKQQMGEGVVTIHQDARLKALVGQVRPYSAASQKAAPKVQGFRVQVFAGNNSQQARNEANKMAEKVKMQFPELEVYTQFVSPRWLCRVGDYRSIEEADVVMRQLKSTGDFKEVSIVRSLIKL
ncbi:MAG: SPOR domain-containing protein [Bacteroidaceae bacterium]|nr:SPOR domain-containing protein [Bacteroidaceae bacterium]MBR3896745.1 SPOR domain-containing protein [Bacteroidaceae bacterium]